ncbi:MAG: hypothetical protein AAF125_24580, partial [Chloroflexota bacterium]
MLGYWARLNVPLFAIPDVSPSLLAYSGVMAMHVLSIMAVFYLVRLYHLPRAVSRIDLARNITVYVMVGTVLAYGSSELIFEDTRFAVDYPQT